VLVSILALWVYGFTLGFKKAAAEERARQYSRGERIIYKLDHTARQDGWVLIEWHIKPRLLGGRMLARWLHPDGRVAEVSTTNL
jgi:hypothetical protein